MTGQPSLRSKDVPAILRRSGWFANLGDPQSFHSGLLAILQLANHIIPHRFQIVTTFLKKPEGVRFFCAAPRLMRFLFSFQGFHQLFGRQIARVDIAFLGDYHRRAFDIKRIGKLHVFINRIFTGLGLYSLIFFRRR